MNDLSTSLSALNAASVITQVAANNIANINTNGFKASDVVLTSGPDNQGVQVGTIAQNDSPGPAVISSISDAAKDLYSQALNNSLLDPAQDNLTTQLAEAMPTVTEGSNTDVVRDVLSLYTAEFMYSSNAAVIQTQDEMTKALLDKMV